MTFEMQSPDWRSMTGWSVILLLAGAFLLAHPFTGVRHDGILYAGDALARLLPARITDDPYFLYGSQGRFTLLPALYAALITFFGLGGGTIVGLLLAAALYIAASLYFIRWLAPAPLQTLCALSLFLGWTIYGGNRVFAFSESFLTARSFAEPAVLLMLALLVRGRVVAAAVALLVALLVHPLIAAGGLAIFWLDRVAHDRRWLWVAPSGLVALVAARWSGLPVFADLFARYDPQWLTLAREANGHAFVTHWSVLDFGVIVNTLVGLWLLVRITDRPELRRLVAIVVATALACTIASLVLVDMASSVFFGKLQIWRALWIMQWLGLATLPLVLVALWNRDGAGRISALLLAIAWMASFNVACGPVALIALAIELAHRRIVISRTTLRLMIAATVIVAVSILLQAEVRVVRYGLLLDQPLRDMIAAASGPPLLILPVVVALLAVQRRLPRLAPAMAALAVVAALVFCWDQRSPWTRTLEAHPIGEFIWPGLVGDGAKVYWYRDMMAPWLLLGHGNYYTQQQASGAVFSRDMIVELERRSGVASMLDMQEQLCRMMNDLSGKADACEPDVVATRTICADGGVDYVVLQSTLENARPLASFATGVVENGYEKKFYLYRCAGL